MQASWLCVLPRRSPSGFCALPPWTQDAQGNSGSQLLQLAQQQATELGSAAAAMPMRVSRIDAFLSSVEAGDTKLRGAAGLRIVSRAFCRWVLCR